MQFLLEALAALLFFLGISGIIYYVKAVCRLPLTPGKDIRIRSTVLVTGEGETLQATVEALLWLQKDGGQPCEIQIDATQAGDAAKRQAALLAKQYKEIDLLL